MTIIHTIALVNEVRHLNTVAWSTKKSSGRRYVACIVAEVTAPVVERLRAIDARTRNETEANLVKYEASYTQKHIEQARTYLASTTSLPTVGSQAVVSWHGTLGNAHAALGAGYCKILASHGYILAVRTDIQVRDTKKKNG